MKKVLIVALLNIVFVGFLWGADFTDKGVGTSSANFLKIPCGARAVGMGEAYASLSNGADAVWWNPAGLGGLDSIRFEAMYTMWFEDIAYTNLAYAHPFDWGVVGVGLNYLSIGSMDRYDEKGEKEGTFKPYDGMASLNYGKRWDQFFAGFGLKFIREVIDDVDAQGVAGDLGIIWRSKEEDVGFGLLIQNLGTEIKFQDEGYPLPLTINVGTSISYKLEPELADSNILTISIDGNAPRDNDISGHLGMEYAVKEIKRLDLFFRAGYKTNTISDLDSLSGLSAGLGFAFDNLGINYVWVPYGDLGDTHRISFTLSM